jgi:glutamate---cysteine ligase / carboxylate-amine ligase
MPAPNAPLQFQPNSAFSLGVEEELLMGAPASLRPWGGTDAVLAALEPKVGSIAGEVSDGVLELITPVCDSAGCVIEVLKDLRREAGRVASLLGAGVHPIARFGDVRLRAGERYEQISETMRGVMRQTPHCGVHVHVGMPDAATVIRACNGMRKWMPLLQALSANSPYWYGRDSGLPAGRHPTRVRGLRRLRDDRRGPARARRVP